MKGRKQKILKDTCLQNSRAEPEGYAGGQTFMRITENNLTTTTNKYQTGYGLLENILSPSNLNTAYKQVKRNKGSGGIDKMEVESLKDYLVENKEKLIQSILDGKYCPNPVRRVEIPKEKGTRKLGIPTVVDRVIQQAIAHQLFEHQFPGRQLTGMMGPDGKVFKKPTLTVLSKVRTLAAHGIDPLCYNRLAVAADW